MNTTVRTLASALLAMAATWAVAQAPNAESAQQIYARDITACNSGNMPAPMREACVREAGERLDRVRGVLPADTAVTTPDGRATVVTPEGAALPPTSADAVPSRDGRANVVPNR